MPRSMLSVFAAVLCLPGIAAGQSSMDIVDMFAVQVKPEKRTEFEAGVKKMVDANRKHQGDYWLTFGTEYGEQSVMYFASSRENMGAIEPAFGAFLKAMNAAYGQAGAQTIFTGWAATTISSHGELHRRRPDLGVNPPATPEAFYKALGGARWMRTITARLKPGKLADFIQLWMPFRDAIGRHDPNMVISVSQAMTGGHAIYFTTFAKTLGEFDQMDADYQKLQDGDVYKRFAHGLSEVVASGSTDIYRIHPELSHVRDEVASVDPGFWRPKPPAAAKPKPKEAAPPKQ